MVDEAIASDQQKTAGTANPAETSTKGEEADAVATTSADETEVATLKKELAQAKKLQGQADRKARQERLARKRLEQRLKTGEPSSSESEEEEPAPEMNQEVEKAIAESKMTRLAFSDEKYRKVLEADPTLRRIVESNPLALVKNPLDAEDAVMQLQEILDTRADEISQPSSEKKSETKKKEEPTAKETPSGFGAEAVNPQNVPVKKYEDTLKNGNVDDAVWDKMNDPANWNKPA